MLFISLCFMVHSGKIVLIYFHIQHTVEICLSIYTQNGEKYYFKKYIHSGKGTV
jgi:hypothetical protein